MRILPQLVLAGEYWVPTWAAAIAGVFVLLSLSLSSYLLFQHLSAYKNPEEQKFLIGVILMVPCYAVESEQDSIMRPPLRQKMAPPMSTASRKVVGGEGSFCTAPTGHKSAGKSGHARPREGSNLQLLSNLQ